MTQKSPAANPSKSAYLAPDFEAPLDVDAILAAVPESAAVKGIFLAGLKKRVRQLEDGDAILEEVFPRAYEGRRNYSRRETMRVELDISRRLYPDQSDRSALRMVAREIYPLYHRSVLGKILLWPLSNDVGALLRLGPRAIRSVVNFGEVGCEKLGASHVRYHYRDYYSWLDAGDIGMLEGLVLSHGAEPAVKIARGDGRFNLSVDLQWTARAAPA